MQGSDKHQMMYDEASGKVSLLIKAIGPGDEGEYTCQAYNHFGFANSNCRLKVGAPPKIEYMPKELHLPEGDNSKIKIKT